MCAAFQSPILMYDLGELYDQGLSTPSKDENRFCDILLNTYKPEGLLKLAVQKLHFRVDQIIDTEPWDSPTFIDVVGGWWKATKGIDVFGWDTWYKEALEKYGDGSI
jgi:hypothetical protein